MVVALRHANDRLLNGNIMMDVGLENTNFLQRIHSTFRIILFSEFISVLKLGLQVLEIFLKSILSIKFSKNSVSNSESRRALLLLLINSVTKNMVLSGFHHLIPKLKSSQSRHLNSIFKIITCIQSCSSE